MPRSRSVGARNERFNILTDVASIVNSVADGTKKRVPVIAVEPQRHGFLAVLRRYEIFSLVG